MAIQRKPKGKKPSNVEDFISGAPDAGSAPSSEARKGVKKGRKEQITVTMPTERIEKLDAMAERECLSRAALINMGVQRLLDRGITIDGLGEGDD